MMDNRERRQAAQRHLAQQRAKGEALLATAAPDRPGDRDQRQAAELVDAWDNGYLGTLDELTTRVAAALAAARAEEAARWRAKIEAVEALLRRAEQFSGSMILGTVSPSDLRRALDAS